MSKSASSPAKYLTQTQGAVLIYEIKKEIVQCLHTIAMLNTFLIRFQRNLQFLIGSFALGLYLLAEC